jgi:hypothetical protein
MLSVLRERGRAGLGQLLDLLVVAVIHVEDHRPGDHDDPEQRRREHATDVAEPAERAEGVVVRDVHPGDDLALLGDADHALVRHEGERRTRGSVEAEHSQEAEQRDRQGDPLDPAEPGRLLLSEFLPELVDLTLQELLALRHVGDNDGRELCRARPPATRPGGRGRRGDGVSGGTGHECLLGSCDRDRTSRFCPLQ